MKVYKSDARATKRGPSDWFTGTAWLDEIIVNPAPSRLAMSAVTFEPGARTFWHTHPVGQTLYVLSGIGRVQKEGEPVQILRPGDTAQIAPGEKHWHGAAPDRAFVHIAAHESDNGSVVTWLEPVSDDDYR